MNENCHLFIKWRKHKIHILEENCHWYIKWHSKENTTKSYTNFVLQKLPLKDGGNIYPPTSIIKQNINYAYIVYIAHSACNIVTIKFKGRVDALKNPCKLSWPTKFVKNVCVTQKRRLAENIHITDIHIHIRCTN